MDITIETARSLIGDVRLWPRIRAYLAGGGESLDFPPRDPSRLRLLSPAERAALDEWIDAIVLEGEWRKTVDGAKVRKLRAEYPCAYPAVFRYALYFRRVRAHLDDIAAESAKEGVKPSELGKIDFDTILLLLKLKFPEVYALCCS